VTDLLPGLALAAVAVAIFWAASRTSYVFVVRIEDGSPRLSQGKVAAVFQQRIADACRRNGVRDGWVGGVRKGRRVSLAFSRSIPHACQQQLRNEWAMSG
jgi:hypothetical protein